MIADPFFHTLVQMKAAADGEQSPPPPKTVQIRNISHLLITPDWCLSTSSVLCLFCCQSALDDGLIWAAKRVLTCSREKSSQLCTV